MYGAARRNEVPTHATTRVNPKDIMLSERSQTKDRISYDSTYMKYSQ